VRVSRFYLAIESSLFLVLFIHSDN